MAHNLNKTKTGEVAFATVNEIAWHKLGTVVEKKMTSADAIKHAHLGYVVEKTPALAKINSKTHEVPEQFVTYRKDTGDIFGIVGSRYEIVQNKDAFTFFDAIVGDGAAIYETAGALGKGERLFITAKLPKHIKVGSDVIEQYIILTSTHDGSGAIRAAFTPVRIVCANTLQMALRNSQRMVSIRHTKNVQEQLKQAHKLMGIVADEANFMGQNFVGMSKMRITDKQLRAFITLAMHPEREQITKGEFDKDFSKRFENLVDEIVGYATTHETQLTKETKGTLYGAYNSISGYFQNVKQYDSAEDKVQTIVYGTGSRKTAHSMDIALGVLSKQIRLS
jgi:phage/plasmid-like protein (TIGR03299 family)